MQTIAIVNEKGGTGKTTTSVNLAAALGEMGERILLVDLDGQAASSRWLGVENDTRLADAMLRGGGLEPIEDIAKGLSLAPGSGKLDSVAHDLRPTQGGQLRRVLAEIGDRYNYVLIDCPPSLGNRLIGNALLASSHAIAPVEPSVLALDGLGILLTTLQDVREGFGHNIVLLGALACRYDARTRLSKLVLAELRRALPGKVFNTVIRETVRMQECPASGKSILEYAPTCQAAIDYRDLAKELVSQPALSTDHEVSDEDMAKEGNLSETERQALAEFRRAAVGMFNPSARSKGPRVERPADQPSAGPEQTEEAQAGPVAVEVEEEQDQPVTVAVEAEEEQDQPVPVEVEAQTPASAPAAEKADEADFGEEDAFEAVHVSEEGVDEEPTVDIEGPSSEELADARSEAKTEMDEALADQPDNLATEAQTGRMDETPDRGGTGDDHAARATKRALAAGAKRKKMMLAAAAAPVVLVAVIVLAWKIAGGQRPQAASAEPVAAVASPARSHAHAKAARTAKEPAPAPQAEMVQPVPETETPSAAEAAAAEAATPTTMPVASPVEQASPAPALVPETAADVAAEPLNVAPRDQAETDERQADHVEYIPCPSGYSLTCVMKSPSGYLAMINGKSARLGQTINDAKVVEISLKSVEMQLQDGKRFTLGIGQKGGSGGGSSSQPSQD